MLLITSTVHFLIPFQWSMVCINTTWILGFSNLSTNSDLEILPCDIVFYTSKACVKLLYIIQLGPAISSLILALFQR